MRVTSLIFAALPAIWAAQALSQDSSDETPGSQVVTDAPPMPPVRVFRGPFRIEPDTAISISEEDIRENSLFNAPALDEPSNVLAISNIDLSDGRYSVSVPFLTEQRGVYDVYLLHQPNSDDSAPVAIEGTYTLKNEAAEDLLSGRFKLQLDAAAEQTLITVLSFTRDRAIETRAFVIDIDSGTQELQQGFSRLAVQLEKKRSGDEPIGPR